MPTDWIIYLLVQVSVLRPILCVILRLSLMISFTLNIFYSLSFNFKCYKIRVFMYIINNVISCFFMR